MRIPDNYIHVAAGLMVGFLLVAALSLLVLISFR